MYSHYTPVHWFVNRVPEKKDVFRKEEALSGKKRQNARLPGDVPSPVRLRFGGHAADVFGCRPPT